MKKLMIAAAAAAMVSGAFAENNYTNVLFAATNYVAGGASYFDTNAVIQLPTTSILTFKQAKDSDKVFSLNYKDFEGESKKFKAFKTGVVAVDARRRITKAGYAREATDGVIYYDASTNSWVVLQWSKKQEKSKSIMGTWYWPEFTVFGDDADPAKTTKAYAAYAWNPATDLTDGGTNAVATCYAKLNVKGGTVDKTIKSLKNLDKDVKVSIKNYKDAAACKNAVDKFLKKYNNSKAKEVK